MEEKLTQIKEYIEAEKADMQQKIDDLVKDERSDDARAYRASLNIYDIMATLIDTAKNKANGNEQVLVDEFHGLASRIPAGWKVSLEKAKEHDDYEKVMMEEAKLSVVEKVMEKFDSIF